jgi:hypothetical protein
MVSAAAADAPKYPILKTLESRYNRAQSLQVQFSETYSGAGRASKTEAGTLFLRKPGRMRWEYSSPAGKLFVSDGKVVYLYLPGSGRVEKMNLKQTEDMRAPLAFLLGKLNFEKEFQNIEAVPVAGGTRITAIRRPPIWCIPKCTLTAREIQTAGDGAGRSVLDYASAVSASIPGSDTVQIDVPPARNCGGRSINGGVLLKYADARGEIHQQVAEAATETRSASYSQQGFPLYSVCPRRWQGFPPRSFFRTPQETESGKFLIFNQQFVTLVRADCRFSNRSNCW